MEEFSDSTNRFIIIFISLLFYIYLNYRQVQLKMNKNFKNIKCNPLDMMVGGLINEEESSKTFASCMEYSTAENTSKMIEKTKDKQEKEIAEIIKDLSNNEIDKTEEQKQLFNLINTKTNNVNDIVNQQKEINNSINTIGNPLQNIITQISNITNKLKSITNNIKNK